MIAHKLSILELAAYYEKSLTDQQVKIYSEQLAEALTADEAMRAVKLYYNNPENEFFPRPVSKLIALIKKPIENKDQTQNVLNLIKKAVNHHQSTWVQGYFDGYDDNRAAKHLFYNNQNQAFGSWQEAAESELGTLGVTVVERLGGWVRVCSRYNEEPEGVVTGQLIKNIEAIMNIAEVGALEQKPSLPAPNSSVLKLMNVKSLPGA